MIETFIFIWTIYISSRLDLMYENITGVSLLPEFHIMVIFFTIFSSCYFAFLMLQIYQQIPNHKIYQFLIILTAIIMSLGSFFPYTLNQHDLSSTLHVSCSMFGCISFLILLFIYTRKIAVYNTVLYLKVHWFYDMLLQLFCILFLFFGRVNGYIEILFSFIVCFYLLLIRFYNKRKFKG